MYENVVAVILSKRFSTQTRHRGSKPEDKFYERFASPFPRWLAGFGRLPGC
jgi:hypothetical protein